MPAREISKDGPVPPVSIGKAIPRDERTAGRPGDPDYMRYSGAASVLGCLRRVHRWPWPGSLAVGTAVSRRGRLLRSQRHSENRVERKQRRGGTSRPLRRVRAPQRPTHAIIGQARPILSFRAERLGEERTRSRRPGPACGDCKKRLLRLSGAERRRWSSKVSLTLWRQRHLPQVYGVACIPAWLLRKHEKTSAR
jgi:hypothetical protein